MSVIPVKTIQSIAQNVNRAQHAYVWQNIAQNDTMLPLESGLYSDKTVHIFGTFDGATLTMQGSNDPRVVTDSASAEWFDLTDLQGNAIAKTTASGEVVAENPLWIKPVITGGSGATLLNVTFSARS